MTPIITSGVYINPVKLGKDYNVTNSKWDNMKALSLETQVLQQNRVQVELPVPLTISNIKTSFIIHKVVWHKDGPINTKCIYSTLRLLLASPLRTLLS